MTTAAASKASLFDLDYLSGRELPKTPAAADFYVSVYQNVSRLDTFTGQVPEIDEALSPEDSESMAEFKSSVSIFDLIKKAQEAEPRDRVSARASFEALSEWEGYVVEVNGDKFSARLTNLSAKTGTETDLAVFSTDDISDDDKVLVKEGAIFRWSVGYERTVGGARKKVSSIVFRRLPIWTDKEIAASAASAHDLLQSISWD